MFPEAAVRRGAVTPAPMSFKTLRIRFAFRIKAFIPDAFPLSIAR